MNEGFKYAAALLMAGTTFSAQNARVGPRQLIGESTDITFLEQLAVSMTAAARFAAPYNWSGKSARSEAFLRLNALGSAESLAAAARVEAAIRALPPIAQRTSSSGIWNHPADHMGDLEEATLGTNATSSDTDGDGIPDGADVCPLYAPPVSEREDEEAAMLRAALFAAYGLTDAPYALRVQPGNRAVQLQGLPGPVLFDQVLPRAPGGLGVYVRWSATRSATEGTITLHDWEGNLAASTEAITLRRVGGRWLAVARRLVSIS